MAHWLLKEEPTHYSYHDLAREGSTRWTGVHNALALRNLRRMRKGDLALYYHTGSERACVGIVRISSDPRPDSVDPRGSVWVEVRPVRPLHRPIPLSDLREDRALADFDLLRIPRLSVVAVSDEQWSRILNREGARMPAAGSATGASKGPARAVGQVGRRTAARRRR